MRAVILAGAAFVVLAASSAHATVPGAGLANAAGQGIARAGGFNDGNNNNGYNPPKNPNHLEDYTRGYVEGHRSRIQKGLQGTPINNSGPGGHNGPGHNGFNGPNGGNLK